MKLSYRGIQYNQESLYLKADVTRTSGRYRGEESKINRVSNAKVKHTNAERTYRGVHY